MHSCTLRNGHMEAEHLASPRRTFPLTRMYMKIRVWNLGPWSHRYNLSSKSKTQVLIQVHAHRWEVQSQGTTFLSTCLAFNGVAKHELPFPSSIGKVLPPSCQKSFQSLLPNLPTSRESKHISKCELNTASEADKRRFLKAPLNRGAHQRLRRNHSWSFRVS